MRKSVLFSAIAAAALFSTVANAQVISIGVQFGRPAPVVVAPPPVRPVVYDNFYYLPEVDAYYSVNENLYYYNNGYTWVPVTYIPGYRSYDWRTSVRYQIHATRPYMNHNYYVTRYGSRDRGWVDNRRYDNRPDYRGNDRFDDRNRWNNNNRRPDPRYDDRGNGPQRGNDGRGRNDQPAQPNRPQGEFERPQSQPQTQPQRGGGFDRPQGQPQAQPQQGGGRERGGRGDFFTGNQSNGVTRIARN